jgi:PTS system nitrogen regulatory IIA component
MSDPPLAHSKEPIDLAEFLGANNIVVGARAKDKDQLLRELSTRASALSGIDPNVVFDALRAREALGSTGLGEGFALPHAKVAGLGRLFGMFVRLGRPILFDAIDDKPVDLVFLLLVPASGDCEYLAVLAAVCRKLRDPQLAARLRKAPDSEAILSLMCEPQFS